jgi:hypothetical protein
MTHEIAADPDHAAQLEKARFLWDRRHVLAGTVAEVYLRWRRYSGPLPPTMGFLPSRGDYPPALIGAFALPTEDEPGKLSVAVNAVMGVHLTRLQPDGRGKADSDPDKIMIGRSIGTPIVLSPVNDLLGLVICEGIETGLGLFEATGCGVWVAGAASRMPALADKVPSYIDTVTVAGEPDGGRSHAIELTTRLRVRGINTELRIFDEPQARAA